MPPMQLARYQVGSENHARVIAAPQAGHLYFIRIASTIGGNEIPIDPTTGIGLRARFTLNECRKNEGTDNPANGIDNAALPFPHWEQDITTGIYVPPGRGGQIDVLGGDPAATVQVFLAWIGRPLGISERPPVRTLTYQQATRARAIQLVDLASGPAEVRGAVEVVSPIAVTIHVVYAGAAVAVALSPGVPFSLAAAVSVEPQANAPLTFLVQW